MSTSKSIKALYETFLEIMCHFIGDGETVSSLLDQIGMKLFPLKWKGVFSSDEKYPLTGYCIVNLDKASQPGSHWVAVANGHVYDSFGRCGLLKGRNLKCSGDGVAEQYISEENCGQRCLAWLCVHQTGGLHSARLI